MYKAYVKAERDITKRCLVVAALRPSHCPGRAV